MKIPTDAEEMELNATTDSWFRNWIKDIKVSSYHIACIGEANQ